MKINYGQILFMVLALVFTFGVLEFITRKKETYKTYMIITKEKKTEYIRTQESLFLRDSSGCVTNGKENIQCGVKYLTLMQE